MRTRVIFRIYVIFLVGLLEQEQNGCLCCTFWTESRLSLKMFQMLTYFQVIVGFECGIV
jgi:hypothetical protein